MAGFMAKEQENQPALRELERILDPAYRCKNFDKGQACCKEMRWDIPAGHVPRGFRGACGEISSVELVLVLAEPGDPQPGEAREVLKSRSDYARRPLDGGKGQFQRNLSTILNLCWPGASYEEQKRKVWITESVLCSAPRECGPVPQSVVRACGEKYLLPQLRLFPKALIVALGRKAQKRLSDIGVKEFLPASAAAPPEGNKPKARVSWRKIAEELQRRRLAKS
jgi:hypothetical protein